MVFCFEERSRDPTDQTPVPRGMGLRPCQTRLGPQQKTMIRHVTVTRAVWTSPKIVN